MYNRGVDKRVVFSDDFDMQRFFQSIEEFNVVEPIGSIYENSFVKNNGEAKHLSKPLGHQVSKLPLVNVVCYCVNPNHYHFILEQVADKGIEKFMQRLGNGYTKYFNNKHRRSGSLFQGVFKSIHVDTNEYLLHLSAYVNLNDRVHQLGHQVSKLVKSRTSWGEYMGEKNTSEKNVKNIDKIQDTKLKRDFCTKDIILEQFRNKKEYREFAESSLSGILERRADMKDVEKLLLE